MNTHDWLKKELDCPVDEEAETHHRAVHAEKVLSRGTAIRDWATVLLLALLVVVVLADLIGRAGTNQRAKKASARNDAAAAVAIAQARIISDVLMPATTDEEKKAVLAKLARDNEILKAAIARMQSDPKAAPTTGVAR